MTQLAIDLPYRAALGRADFLVSASNAEALGWIERWPDWPGPSLVIHGASGSGKTHLAHLWRERCAGIIVAPDAIEPLEPLLERAASVRGVAIDEAERVPELPLLHLYNWCGERSIPFLLLSRVAPGIWPIGLPDLASRLRGLPAVEIAAPDDRLLAAVLVKHFSDRGLRVAPEVIGYLVRRMERSFAAAAELAGVLDRLAMSRGSAVTLRLARSALSGEASPRSRGISG